MYFPNHIKKNQRKKYLPSSINYSLQCSPFQFNSMSKESKVKWFSSDVYAAFIFVTLALCFGKYLTRICKLLCSKKLFWFSYTSLLFPKSVFDVKNDVSKFSHLLSMFILWIFTFSSASLLPNFDTAFTWSN